MEPVSNYHSSQQDSRPDCPEQRDEQRDEQTVTVDSGKDPSDGGWTSAHDSLIQKLGKSYSHKTRDHEVS